MSSAKPYIGCKIGLISKAQNRYEGILYTIDKVNSTVVLAKGEWPRPVFYSLSTCQEKDLGFCCRVFYMLMNIEALLNRGCHFDDFIQHCLFTSEVFWNRGTTH